VSHAFSYCQKLDKDIPKVILAQTIKGKGVALLEDQPGWHGKVLSEQELEVALSELMPESGPKTKETEKELESVLNKLNKLQNE
jgi:transketolase